jgi:hypothetical protein
MPAIHTAAGMTGEYQTADMTVDGASLNSLGRNSTLSAHGEQGNDGPTGDQPGYYFDFHVILILSEDTGISPSFRYLCGLNHYGVSAK